MDVVPPGTVAGEGITEAELRLAARNHGLPLEALRHDITPPGLHYLLIHYDIPAIDPETYRLEIAGAVARPISLSLDALRERTRAAEPITFECAGNGRALLEPRPLSQPWLTEAVGTAEWGGTPLAPLLDEAGVSDDAVEVLFTGEDRGIEGGVPQAYERSLPVAEAEQGLLAYEMNGEPLLPQHGFPLRLVVPGWYGMQNVKWLVRITVLEEPFTGYQNAVGYRMYEADGTPGEPVTRMLPRSLLVPPGIPDFLTRERTVDAGRMTITGRAWSGFGEITRVEFSGDGAATWTDAQLDAPVDRHAWRGWHAAWYATPGRHELAARATDAAGNTQPLEGTWNHGGYCNNSVQRVAVNVR